MNRYTTNNSFRQRLNDIFIVFQCSHLQTTQCSAIFFSDNKILCHIH